MKTWQETGFTVEITMDGSPTLRASSDAESMHHSGGALDETLLIYGLPIKEIFETLPEPRIYSLGLGLGYVEMVTASYAVLNRKSFVLETAESEDSLKAVFAAWVQQTLPDGEVKDVLLRVRDQIAARLDVNPEEISATLKKAMDEKRWTIGGALSLQTIPSGPFHGFMYDAFSAKTSPELWSEEFLKEFLKTSAADDAVFTTYACTGNLKRALKFENFKLFLRDGFKHKRNSTLARRGIFNPKT